MGGLLYLDKKIADTGFIMNAANSLCEQPSDAQQGQLGHPFRLIQRNGIGQDELVERRLSEAVESRATENRMSGARQYPLGLFLAQGMGRMNQRSAGIDH